MAVFPIEDDICEKKASDFLWETLYVIFKLYPEDMPLESTCTGNTPLDTYAKSE